MYIENVIKDIQLQYTKALVSESFSKNTLVSLDFI